MEITSYKADSYVLREHAKDFTNNLTGGATKSIDLYSGGKHVASAFFVHEDLNLPEATALEGIIYFYAPHHQYEAVIERLTKGKPVYIAWSPISYQTNPNKGEAYFHNNLFHLNCV